MTDIPRLTVSASPHVRCKDTTQSIMRDVIIALVPAGIAAGFPAQRKNKKSPEKSRLFRRRRRALALPDPANVTAVSQIY